MSEPRIYTDPRYPGVEIRNEGGTHFSVLERGVLRESFVGRERRGVALVSEPFAARRATAYFERMRDDDRRLITETAEEARSTEVANPWGRDFADEQVLTPDGVLAAWEQAQAMAEGPEKEKRLNMVRQQATQVETAAGEIVRRMLG